jgi:hypothetical protein
MAASEVKSNPSVSPFSKRGISLAHFSPFFDKEEQGRFFGRNDVRMPRAIETEH